DPDRARHRGLRAADPRRRAATGTGRVAGQGPRAPDGAVRGGAGAAPGARPDQGATEDRTVACAAPTGYRRRVAGDSPAAAAVGREDGDRVDGGLGRTDLRCTGFRRARIGAAGLRTAGRAVDLG